MSVKVVSAVSTSFAYSWVSSSNRYRWYILAFGRATHETTMRLPNEPLLAVSPIGRSKSTIGTGMESGMISGRVSTFSLHLLKQEMIRIAANTERLSFMQSNIHTLVNIQNWNTILCFIHHWKFRTLKIPPWSKLASILTLNEDLFYTFFRLMLGQMMMVKNDHQNSHFSKKTVTILESF